MARYDLTDDEWSLIKDLFPPPAKTGRKRKDPRLIFNAILWIMCTGVPWRDLPQEFGPWQTVYHNFSKWRKDGTLRKIFERLRDRAIELGKVGVETWCVDGTAVRATRAAAGGGKKGVLMSHLITL